MTGVGQTPRTFEEYVRFTDKRLISLERRQNGGGGGGGLPARLSTGGAQVTDWNTVTENGFYWSQGTANAPTADWYVGIVKRHEFGGRVIQELRRADTNLHPTLWVRYWNSTSWTPWKQQGGAARGLATLNSASFDPGGTTYTTVPVLQEFADLIGFASGVFTIQQAGWYHVDWFVRWSAVTGGRRQALVAVNNTDTGRSFDRLWPDEAQNIALAGWLEWNFLVGDTVAVQTFQTGAATARVVSASLGLHWIRAA